MTRPDLFAYAAKLHRHGITPLPTRSDGTKAPAVKWREWTTTRPGPAELKEWFTPGSTDGIGMLTGTPSGGITMLEVEGRAAHLLDQIAERMDVRGLGDLWGRIDSGWVERSPSGGIHWHYRTDRPRPNTKIARRPGHHPGVVDVLIETRGEGGFTILAPSNGRTHPTGVSWNLLRGGPGTIPTVTADEQDMLFAVLAEFDAMPVTDSPPTPPSRPAQPGAPGARPGDDFSARVTWDEILTPHGWTRGRVMGHGHAWTRPDKRLRDGISATTGQAADGVDRLYVFSTSTEFEAGRPVREIRRLGAPERARQRPRSRPPATSPGKGTESIDHPANSSRQLRPTTG
jgi:putative DNA primase/helicase